jgi:PAS domain S-box-containing protein
MKSPDIPSDEQERLQALKLTELLDSPREERFDRLTRVARDTFNVTTALISLIDSDRQWFKSAQGLEASETPRNISFCGHAILADDILVIENALDDERFADNPLVADEPAIRFYAGAPLRTLDGYRLGTLCLIESRPRSFTAKERRLLRDLADCVEGEINHEQTRELNKKLGASEKRARLVIEGTDVGTWEWNIQTGDIILNERWADIVGYSLDELAPVSIETWQNFAHPEDQQESERLLKEHFAGRSAAYDFKCRMKHKKGHWVWVHSRGRVFEWTQDGSPMMMYGTHADITAQQQAEAALSDSEQRLRGLFELSPVGIALNDYETGRFIDVNPALLQPTGFSREELKKLSYPDVTPIGRRELEAEILDGLSSRGQYGPIESQCIRKDGSRYPVRLQGMKMRETSGRLLTWSLIEDISERRQVERMKNEFVSMVSHELRTPLTALIGALGLVAGGALGELPTKASGMITLAQRNSERLGHLIDDLLDIEKLVAGKLPFHIRPCTLLPVIEDCIASHRPHAAVCNVKLHLSAETNNICSAVDDQRLQQALGNLISNAVKFSPPHSSVTIALEKLAEKALVRVTDQGEGVPDDFRERIFQRFAQADSSDARRKGGTGLGLAITRELVERMDGKIGFDSVQGKGASFWITLPLVDLPSGMESATSE